MTEERHLLEATIQGDTAAFELIVRKYQNLVCAITFGGTGKIEASEELAQETFFNAWRNISKLKDLERFRPWLCSIARNLVRNYHRERKPEVSLPDSHIDTLDPDNNPSEKAVSREEAMILEQAISRIPMEYREPLVLFYRQGRSIRQVADGLGLNEATVKTRLHRGRQMLKEQTAELVERTLERTVPDARFTKAIMMGIGAGLAAGAAGTAMATAATLGTTEAVSAFGTAGGSFLSTAPGLLGTLAGKIAVAAAAMAITAGVAIYTYNNSHQQNSANQRASQINSEVNDQSRTETSITAVREQKFNNAANYAGKSDSLAALLGIETEGGAETVQDLPSTRHPDWPGLDEPIENIYMKLLDGKQTWIHLPRRFREEDTQTILIDNGTDRIEINKKDKTVQYSETLTGTEPPMYKYDQSLIQNDSVKFANLFRGSKGIIADPNIQQEYTVRKIGEQDDGLVLIYEINAEHPENEKYDAKAYVDAGTQLPEKLVVTVADPNSPTKVQIMEEVVFNFAPISDSVFEYVAKNDETVLPFRQQPCFRGQVVDTIGDSVAGADIFIHYFPLYGKDYLTGKSDANGDFEIKLPEKPGNETVFLPVHYWATIPDNPNLTAWTILCTDDYFFVGDIRDYISGHGGDIIQTDSGLDTVSKTENGITTEYQRMSTIQEKPVIGNIRLVMEPTGTIGGYVTDKGGNAISSANLNASFQACDEKGQYSRFRSSESNWKFTAVSDSTGYYEFKTLPALWKGCRYTITVSAVGYVSESKELILEDVLDYQEFNISLNPQLVTIRGILMDNYRTVLENRSVFLSAPNMSIRDCSTQTDPNGCFVLEGCPDIPGLTVRAGLTSASPALNQSTPREVYESYVYYPDVEQEISYVAGQKEYFVEMTAIRPETKVEVIVTDSKGHSLSEFKVRIDDILEGPYHHPIAIRWREEKLEKRTDRDGRVYFDNIPDLKQMQLILLPVGGLFPTEMHALNGNQKEERLRKIDQTYEELYQPMEIPVELVEGQKNYSIRAVVLTKEEFQSLQETAH
jgi:RNA polymerase sigma factor (sigma-70 family)